MKYGVFDHVDFGTGNLNDLYGMRLALIEKYDATGFYGYHQAEHQFLHLIIFFIIRMLLLFFH